MAASGMSHTVVPSCDFALLLLQATHAVRQSCPLPDWACIILQVMNGKNAFALI
jgi:hypothetical protein